MLENTRRRHLEVGCPALFARVLHKNREVRARGCAKNKILSRKLHAIVHSLQTKGSTTNKLDRDLVLFIMTARALAAWRRRNCVYFVTATISQMTMSRVTVMR